MNSLTEAAVTVASLIVGVAALSVLVSTKSNTSGVIQSLASGFSNSLGTAMTPITGNSMTINTSYGQPNTSAGSPSLNG